MEHDIDIKALRRRLGLTQKALADAAGVKPNTVARWERGELGISDAMVDRLEALADSRGSGSVLTRPSATTLDPHHRAILDGLNGSLDSDAFELCAADLIRREWPTLVPVRGGADDGFDGAVADGTGEPFPLVTTTGAKLVDNLSSSLDRTKRRGWHPTRALFATSRRITPTMRGKLFAAARERGVTLCQAYDQDWFALCLYREPAWCQRLLRVTGQPPALSLFPGTRRPLLGAAVLGREREMRWLLEHDGDCLVVGEPGSGKTFLLRSLALQGHARFLVDGDRKMVANDLRSLSPAAVIVDDAHVKPDQITELDQIRREVRAKFRIIATSWPGAADDVRRALKIGHNDELQLSLVDADTMVEIIKSVGVPGPDQLLRIIRMQAAGRPGLAATLAHLCLSGNVREVISGESLVSDLAPELDRMLGIDTLTLLAPFALAGDGGTRPDAVAKCLGKPPADMTRDLAQLSAAGVIRRRANKAISVEPEPMRWIFVKRVFFDGPAPLDVDPFLHLAEDRLDALRTLIGARSRGAGIPELERWLEEAKSPKLWMGYASAGPVEAQHALRRHPELIDEIAPAALAQTAEMSIPMLLDRMVGDDGHSGESGKAPMDHLKTWAKGIPSGGAQALERRLELVRETVMWWTSRRNGAPAIQALCVALMPGLDYSVPDPGVGNTISYVSRMLSDGELGALVEQWPAVLNVVRETEHVPWSDLFELVEAWLHPQEHFFPPIRFSATTNDILRSFAHMMLEGLASISRQHPGVQHRIAGLAQDVEMSIELNLHPEFEILVPPESFDRQDWKEQDRLWSAALVEFAERRKKRPLDDTASLLEWCEHEADLAGIHHPRLSHRFCSCIAERVSDPVAAAGVFIRYGLPSALVAPFVRRAAAYCHPGWMCLAGRCLKEDEHRWSTVETVLSHPAPPCDLLAAALSEAEDMPHLEDFLNSSCLRIPDATIREMLQSNVSRVAMGAAVSYWLTHRGNIGESLRTLWQRAILRSVGVFGGQSNGYWLGEILSKDTDLAVEWLVSNLTGGCSPSRWTTWKLAKTVAASLGVNARKTVLTHLAAAGVATPVPDVIQHLVSDDLHLYRQLLNTGALDAYHLEPLSGGPGDGWRRMALAALDWGYSTQHILDATIDRSWSWSGSESEMWEGRLQGFRSLVNDQDHRIAEIGRTGIEYMSARKRAAIDRETDEAVRGHD